MRVLHIISTTDPAYGGPVESVAQLGSWLARHEVQVDVAACTDPPAAPWIPRYPLRVHALGPGTGRYGYSPRLTPWLRRSGTAYDAWVINGIWQYHAHAAARIARQIGKPYFVYTHGMLDPWSRRAHPIKYLKKLAYWALFEQWTLRHASAVLFTADEESALAKRYFPFGRWNAFTVGAGIADPPPADPRRKAELLVEHAELRGKRIWLYLGRIHEKKGLDLLLRSFATVAAGQPDVHLLIVGGGEATFVARLKRLAGELGVRARVTFLGPLYGDAKWIAYEMAELFVLPSHQENFGIAVAEALGKGVPVCVTNRINIWRKVEETGSGLVCDDSREGLAQALRRWLSLDEEARRAFGTGASSCFHAHFHVSRAASRLVGVLEGAASHRAE